MNELKILKSACQDEWYAKTYQEYLDACASDFEKVLAVVTDCATSEDISEEGLSDEELNTPVMKARIEAKVAEKLNESGLSYDLPLNVNEGFVKIGDLCASALWSGSSDSLSTTEPNPFDVLYTPTGSVNVGKVMNFATKFDALKTNYQSTVVTAAGFLASAKSTISDRIATFDNALLSRLQSGASNLTSTTNFIRAQLQTCPSAVDFATSVFANSFPEGTADEASDVSYGNSDISLYTGANPLIAVDFSCAAKAATTVAKVGAKIVKGVFGAIIGIGKQLFSKAKEFVVDTVVDPEILAELEGGGKLGLIDGFQYDYTGTVFFQTPFAHSMVDAPTQKFSHKWVKFQTYFGELLMRLDEVVAKAVSGVWGFQSTGSWVFKPSFINVDAIPSSLPRVALNTPVSGEDSVVSHWQSFLDAVRKSPDLFGSKRMTNEKAVAGYAAGAIISQQLFRDACLEMLEKIEGRRETVSDILATVAQYVLPSVPAGGGTNVNLISAASGYNQVTNVFDTSLYGSPMDMSSKDGLFAAAATLLILQEYDRSENPTGWTFIPYSNNTTNFEDPSYRIRTDAELQSVLTTFLTTAVVVVIVAAVAVGALTAVKRISRARYFKSAQTAGSLDNKMWQGEALSKKEQRQYLRAQKKMARNSTMDFTGASSNEATTGDYGLTTMSSLHKLITVITGSSE